MILTQEQEIVALTAGNHFLVNEVSVYLHNASQRDKEELTNLLAIDKLEFNVDKLTAGPSIDCIQSKFIHD